MELFAFAAAIAAIWWGVRYLRKLAREMHRQREPWSGKQGEGWTSGAQRPDRPRFETWEQAFNREAPVGLRYLIEYADADGVITEREITPRSIHLMQGEPEVYVKAFCHLRDEERTFYTGRVLSARNLVTGRRITNLASHLRGRC